MHLSAHLFAKAVFVSVVVASASSGCSGGANGVSPLPAPALAQPHSTHRALDASNGTLLTELPTFADGIVDSMGVNTHFSYGQYNSRYAAVKSALLALGVRHIRDGLEYYSAYQSHLVDLAGSGIHATITTAYADSMHQVATYPAYLPGVIEAFEGPNEPNDAANWVTDVRSYQHALYSTVKNTAATATLPVLGPAIAWRIGDWALLGNISADLDDGNIHDYFAGTNPGSGAIAANMAGARIASGSKPIRASETGYCTSWSSQSVPASIMAKYVPRMFFEQYMSGITRTLEYEFIDEDSFTYDLWNNCGLLYTNLTPKPAYWALKHIIAQLADPGPWFARRTLTYAISDGSADVHHLLLQKRDGSVYLAIWLEDSGFNENGQYPTPVAPRTLRVTLAQTPLSATYTSLNADGGAYAGGMSRNGNAFAIAVSDTVSILRITR